MAVKRWLKSYPAYIAALVLIFVVVSLGWSFILKEKKHLENLRLELSAQGRLHEEKLERKKQRLAVVLSHLDDNPVSMEPDTKQSLIGPFAKMKWEYRPKNNIAYQYSIVEIRNAETPLQSQKTLVTGDAAWYPITFLEKLDKPGKYLWRVIPADIDSSGNQRAESNWGPFSVFTIYPSVYDRIKATNQIVIGAYNVEQLEIGGKSSSGKGSCVEASTGLSKMDSEVLCSVLTAEPITSIFSKDGLKPVVKRYSDIDNKEKLLDSLKAGELDIAFGNISSASYRREKRIYFLEYDQSVPMLLTNNPSKVDAEEIGPNEKICTFPGTVYEHISKKLREEKAREYNFEVCQNIYDAMDKLSKKDIQWVLMSRQTWKAINEAKTFKLYSNEKSELLNRVRREIEGDAFAMTDKELCQTILQALQTVKKAQHLQTRPCSSSSN
ncbi:MAG: transporter substrate-binding domain-containing protein [Nitrospira sp.]|nr:transporter substrate-binding domain-containing protein [Nitrospira sp.]